ncbi:MAG: PAS domain S-box protein, partial [Desulfosarcina sp.]|nr:PAS domain S-box protein [Desulfobacterales bacterium]
MLKHAEEINETLFEISNAVNTTLNLDDLFRSIHASLARIIDVTNFFIALVDSEKRTLHFSYHVDIMDEDPSPVIDFDANSSLTGLVVLQRRPILLGKKALEDRALQGGILGTVPVIWMGIPLIVKDTVIGVMTLQSYTDPHLFDPQDLQILTAVSHQIAIAIDRKQSQDELHHSEQRYRQLFDQSNDAIVIHRQGCIIDANQRACRMLGCEAGHLLSLDITKLERDKDLDERQARGDRLISGQAVRFETEWKKADGTFIPVEVSSRMANLEEGIVQSTGRDITDRKQFENALKESEARLRAILGSSPDPIVVYDIQGHPQFINPAFTQVFGWSIDELQGRRIPFVPEDRKEKTGSAIQQLFSTLKPVRFETQRLTRDGDLRDILISAGPIRDIEDKSAGAVVTLTDITERNRLTAQFHAAQKLESIGTLAGGIAHDFNNILTGIIGHVSLMMDEISTQQYNIEPLKVIESYVRDATDLTKQLLGFARGGKFEVKPTNINDLVEKQSRMFGRTKKEITIHRQYEKKIQSVEVDRGQMEQVIMNLYVNAWQAMPGGGDLYVQTDNITVDAAGREFGGVAPGNYVQIAVTDTGVGMDESTRRRIFDPFFTTKEMGRGTGLGLASVYGIIKNHGGFIHVQSQEGRGSTFNIYLPLSGEKVLDEKETSAARMPGSETILLVDDESMIVEVGEKMLQKFGYEVLVARSGKEAVDIYRNARDRIAIVILDMIMPEWDGGQNFDELTKIDPAVKVLLSSGYSIDGQAQAI